MKNLSLRILAVMLSLLFVFSSVCVAGAGENKAVGESAYTTEACSVEASAGVSAKAIYNDFEWGVLALTNKFRISQGVEPVTMFAGIQKACDVREREIMYRFDHDRPDGSEFFTVLQQTKVKYTTAGENIAYGQDDPQEVVTDWINSPGHMENMRRASFNHMGTGYGFFPNESYWPYWVQLFCSHSSEKIKKVYLEGADYLLVKKGTKITDMGITLHESNSVYGDCICPVIDEMCKGYDPDKLGEQTVTVKFRGRKLKFVVNVTETGKGLRLNKSEASLLLGEKVQLTAEVLPDPVPGAVYTWTTSDASVATVDANGLVTSAGKGTCTITAMSADGMTASCKVTVTVKKATALKFDITKYSVTLKNGDSLGGQFQITATVKPKKASASNLSWKSSNTNVATVDANGLVTIVGFGKCNITAKTTDGSKKTATCAVTVNKKYVTKLTISGEKTMKAGETQTLIAAVKPRKAFDKTLTWKSSKPDIATVDANGVVTALKPGKVTITCTAADGSKIKAKFKIKVTN